MLINLRNAMMSLNGTNVPTITATANYTNGLQVKNWIEAECAVRGYTGVYISIARAANFVKNANQVMCVAVDASGVCVAGMRQRGTASFTSFQMNSAYDVTVNSGDVFAVLNAVANGGGYKLRCTRRSHRRSSRPSARFWRRDLWKEVA